VRVAHLADLHLGFRSYRKTTETGVNQREADVALAFRRAVDEIQQRDPDLVLVAGDVFHTSRPPNAVVVEAYRQFRRLGPTPTIIVGGNHDSPRTAESGNILRLLAELPHVRAIVDEPQILRSEDFGVDDASPWAVLGIPHHGEREGERLIERADTVAAMSGRYRILCLHAPLEGEGEALYGGHGLPVEVLKPSRWTFIAAGDYHVRTKLTDRAWYPGSIEFVSSNPWEESKAAEKGFLVADLRTNDVEVVPTHPRTVVDLEPIDAQDLDSEAVMESIRSRLAQMGEGIEEKIVRQVVLNIPKPISRDLDWSFLRELRSRAMHWQLDLRPPENGRGADSLGDTKGAPLPDLLKAFVEKDFEATPGVSKTEIALRAVAAIESLGDGGRD